MQDTANVTYQFEFRGTMEIPFNILQKHRRGSLQVALDLCDAYACQILLHDDGGLRGWVKPDGLYSLG